VTNQPASSHPNSSSLSRAFISLTVIFLALGATAAEPKQGADLLKTDIIAVFAHPDDEIGLATVLARYALGENKVVVNVYTTRGEGGGNMVGTHWGEALGILRETELRQCLDILGVHSCYFLDRLDWAYTESADATMQKWDREETLERLVRLVRALRPDVIVTMGPAPRPGSHGHHQAVGILAIEAFAAAADPDRFPLQLTKEGLMTWQTRRLYFGGSDAEVISTIAVDKPLPDGQTPAEVAGAALVNHRSQAFGNFSNSPWMQRPREFTLVSAFVPNPGSETDLLAGRPVPDSSLAPVDFPKPVSAAFQLDFVPRPAVANYNRWIKEQGIEHIAEQFPADLPVVNGEPNDLQLQLQNTGEKVMVGELTLKAPAGWSIVEAQRLVRVRPGSSTTVTVRVIPPIHNLNDADLTATVLADGHTFQAEAKLHPLPQARAPRLDTAPVLDGTGRGWEEIPALTIGPANRVQGNIADASDSSARFRVAQA